MHILCPHCQHAVTVDELTQAEVPCPACGSTFRLDAQATGAFIEDSQTFEKIDRFEIIKEIGAGAFGRVFMARDPQLDRVVAIKAPRVGNLPTEKDRERMLQEARNAAQLRHPAIVTIHEVGLMDGLPFIVCDYIDGITLADLLRQRRPSFIETANLVATIADALHYAHSSGIVHRDVKPSNVMLESRETVTGPKLMDFGLAKRATRDKSAEDDAIMGTPAYMSPEQARGEGALADGRTDIYSLGVVLYEMLAGSLPFTGSSREMIRQVQREEPRPPRTLNSQISRDLEAICLKAMAKDPAQRYTTAGEFATDLRRFTRGEPIQARPPSRVGRLWRWYRRNRMVGRLAVVLVLVIAGLGTALLYGHFSEQRARDAFELARETLERTFADTAKLNVMNPDSRRAAYLQFQTALPVYESFARHHPTDHQVQFELGRLYASIGLVEAASGNLEKAQASFATARDKFVALVEADSSEALWQEYLTATDLNLALLEQVRGRDQEAEVAFRKAIERRRAIVAQFASQRAYRGHLADELSLWAGFLKSAQRYAEAEAPYREAIAIIEEFPAAERDVNWYGCGNAYYYLFGALLDQLGRSEEADAAFARALDNLEGALESMDIADALERPDAQFQSPFYLGSGVPRAQTIAHLVTAQLTTEAFRRPVEFYRRRHLADPNQPEYQRRLARALYFQGMALVNFNEPLVKMQPNLDEAVALYTSLCERFPAEPKYVIELGTFLIYGSIMHYEKGDETGGDHWCAHGLETLALLPATSRTARVVKLMADAYLLRSKVNTVRREHVSALYELDQALRIDPNRQKTVSGRTVNALISAREQLRQRDGDGAAEESLRLADVITKTQLAKGLILYDAACIFSKAAAQATEPKQKEELAARAVAILRDAFARGFEPGVSTMKAFRGQHPLEYMQKDEDFASLRQREDYQRIVQEQKAKRVER